MSRSPATPPPTTPPLAEQPREAAIVLLVTPAGGRYATDVTWLAERVNRAHHNFGMLCCPGGKVERNETVIGAAIREMEE